MSTRRRLAVLCRLNRNVKTCKKVRNTATKPQERPAQGGCARVPQLESNFCQSITVFRLSGSGFTRPPDDSQKLLCFTAVLFNHQTFNFPTRKAATLHAKVYQRFGPRMNLINHSDILHIPPVNFAGVKNAKFWLCFRHQSPLTLCGFKTDHHVGNLIVAVSLRTIELRSNSDTLPIPHVIFTQGQIFRNLAKFWNFKRCSFKTKQCI